MEQTTEKIAAEVETTIERILRQRLGSYGFKNVNIRSGRDRDGDPVLLIDVDYNRTDAAISPKITLGLTTTIRQALLKLDESRFPHIRHHFDDNQKIAS